MELTVTSLLTSLWLLSSIYFYRQQQPAKLPRTASSNASCLVVYASQTGQARQFAEQLAEQLSAPEQATGDRQQPHSDTQLADMAQITVQELTRYRQVLFVVSTAGHGEPPDSARAFSNAVRRLKGNALAHTNTGFAVLALGDSNYEHFCAYGRWLESELTRCGLKQLWPRTDVNRCAEDDIHQWHQHINQHFGLSTAHKKPPEPQRYRLLHREALNPGSPNAGLFQITLGLCQQTKTTPNLIRAGDVVDIHLPTQEVRSYSVANSPEHSEKHTMDLIVRQHHRADGSPGIGSFYLTERIDGGSEVRLTVRSGMRWRHPEHALPWVLIAAGSGVAGIRSALHWRAQQQGHAPTWVIFGERDPLYDRPCHAEFVELQKQGVITELDYVWSQHPEHGSYVQDVLSQEQERLRHYLLMGGLVYVCGNAIGMGESVDSTMRDLLGDNAMQVLSKQCRYLRDIY